MEIYIRAQLLGALYSVAVGILLGMLYDVVRVSRMMLGLRPGAAETPHPSLPLVGNVVRDRVRGRIFSAVFVFVGDILYFMAATAVYVVFVFHAGNGDNRWFFSLGALCGFLAYFFTVGRLVMRFCGVIRFVLCAVLAYAVFILLFPLRMAFWHAALPALTVLHGKISEKRTKKAGKALAESIKVVYNISG